MNWYQVNVKYVKQFQDGTLKRVNEPFLLMAGSFTEAEAVIYEQVGETVRGEFLVEAIAKQDIVDVIRFEDSDVWHKVVISYDSDDDNGKNKKIKNTFIVSADTVEAAGNRVSDYAKGSISKFEIHKIEKTKIQDVLNINVEA